MHSALNEENAQTRKRVDGESSVCDLLEVVVHAKGDYVRTPINASDISRCKW